MQAIEARDTYERLVEAPANDPQILRGLALMCKVNVDCGCSFLLFVLFFIGTHI